MKRRWTRQKGTLPPFPIRDRNGQFQPKKRGTNFETKFLEVRHMSKLILKMFFFTLAHQIPLFKTGIFECVWLPLQIWWFQALQYHRLVLELKTNVYAQQRRDRPWNKALQGSKVRHIIGQNSFTLAHQPPLQNQHFGMLVCLHVSFWKLGSCWIWVWQLLVGDENSIQVLHTNEAHIFENRMVKWGTKANLSFDRTWILLNERARHFALADWIPEE